MATIILQPTNQSQIDLLVSLAKELKIAFTTVKQADNSTFVKKLLSAGKEAKEIASGKKKGKSLDDLLK